MGVFVCCHSLWFSAELILTEFDRGGAVDIFLRHISPHANKPNGWWTINDEIFVFHMLTYTKTSFFFISVYLFIYLVYCWLQSFQLIDLTEVETYTIHQNFHVFVCVFFRSRGMTLVRVWTSPPPCRLWGEPSPWTEGPLSQSWRWVFPAWSRSRVQCTASMTVKGWD